MIDQAIIRKAVELADGWLIWQDFRGGPEWIDTPFGERLYGNLAGSYLDALAAQLVRQVDALPGNRYADILLMFLEEPDRQTDDRTLDTIKAIVDSGVLE